MTQATSLSRSGLADFLMQRISALVLTLYALCLLSFFLVNDGLGHAALKAFFGAPSMQAFSILAVLATVAHGWIGLWTVGTDYLRPHYFGAWASAWRMAYQAVCGLALFVYAWWGIRLFWSVG